MSEVPLTEAGENDSPTLRMLTYLYPGIPLGLFQTYQYYLEEILGCRSYLSVESRWSAPPTGKIDPFTADETDIAFMCSPGFVRMTDEKNAHMELLPVAPVFDHPKTDSRPLYYSDVIIRSEKALKCKEFADLRGHKWAVNDAESLGGNVAMLNELKTMGVNASFFGHIVHSGSHHESINLVLNNAVDGSAIDSNTLKYWFEANPQLRDELHILCSWGPWPIPPIVVNTRLPVDTRHKIAEALMKAVDHPEYGKTFKKYGLTGFSKVDASFYDSVREAMDQSKNEKLYPAYY